MIIGLTGSFASGKDTVAEYLVDKKGFVHYSLSDIIRDEVRKKKCKVTRNNLISTGIALRTKFGYSVLAERILKKLKKGKNYVITSIRHTGEIEALRKNGDFRLIFVDAPARIRFNRMSARMRENDPRTFRQFLALEKRESQTKGAGQQLGECRKCADLRINNAGSVRSKLYGRVDALVKRMGK
jgi:dephospho-CoA kinase